MFKAIIRFIFLVSFSLVIAEEKKSLPLSKAFIPRCTPKISLVELQPKFIIDCQTMFPYMYQYKQRAVCYALLGFQALLNQASKRK